MGAFMVAHIAVSAFSFYVSNPTRSFMAVYFIFSFQNCLIRCNDSFCNADLKQFSVLLECSMSLLYKNFLQFMFK